MYFLRRDGNRQRADEWRVQDAEADKKTCVTQSWILPEPLNCNNAMRMSGCPNWL